MDKIKLILKELGVLFHVILSNETQNKALTLNSTVIVGARFY